MKLILLYLAVVLCTVCEAAILRNGARLRAATVTGLRLSASNKKGPNTKSSGESQNDNVSDRGTSNLGKELKLGIGGSVKQQSNLETSDAHSLGKSRTHPNQMDSGVAFPFLSGIASLFGLGGGVHADIGVGTKISGHGGSVSADKHSDHSLKAFMENLNTLSEKIASDSEGSDTVKNFEEPIERILEVMAKNHGQTSSSASVSGASSGSNSPNVHPLNDLPTKPSDEPSSLGQDIAASGRNEQNVGSSSSSTGSSTSNEGASTDLNPDEKKLLALIVDTAYRIQQKIFDDSHSAVKNFEESIERILEVLAKNHGQTSTSASVSGTSSGSNSPNVHPLNDLPTKPSDEPSSLGQDIAASGRNEQNVGSSSSSIGSSTSNEGADSPKESSEDLGPNFKKNLDHNRGSGTSSGSNRPNVHPSSELAREPSDEPRSQGQDVAASGTHELNVESSSISTGSATSSEGGDSNKLSGSSSSAIVSTDSGNPGNQDDKQGHEGNGDKISESLGAGSLDTENKSGSGSHNLSSGSGSSVRSTVSTDDDPSVQNEPADPGVSGRVTCPTGKSFFGSSSVA